MLRIFESKLYSFLTKKNPGYFHSSFITNLLHATRPIERCKYLLKFLVDVEVDLEAMTNLKGKLRIRKWYCIKPLVDENVKYELLSLGPMRTLAN